MTNQILGINVNSKPELNIPLIKESVGNLVNTEKDLLKIDFLTSAKAERGNEIASEALAFMDQDFGK